MKTERCVKTPGELWAYLKSNGVTFVLLSSDGIDELGPDVATVTEALTWLGDGTPECENVERRRRAEEIDKEIKEAVRRLRLREDCSFTLFWHVDGSDELHLEQDGEIDRHDALERILHLVHHELGCKVLGCSQHAAAR